MGKGMRERRRTRVTGESKGVISQTNLFIANAIYAGINIITIDWPGLRVWERVAD